MTQSALAVLGMLFLTVAGCKSESETPASPAQPAVAATTAAPTPAPTPAPAIPATTSTTNNGTPMTQNAALHQQVQVDASGGKVVVKLVAENRGTAPVFVPKAVYADDEIFRREFAITNAATGAEVDYIGPMVKRGPFTRDDYVAVAPGARVTNSIDITRSYDFKPGVTYELAYAGAYVSDLAQLDAGSASAATPVRFTFNK